MSDEQPGYAERDQDPTTEQTGGDPEVLEEQESQEGHPGGERPRSDRDAGGPAPAEGDS
jgi:hypothetical protein